MARWSGALALVATLWLAGPAAAIPVALTFEGVVGSSTGLAPLGEVGDPFAGTLVYDTSFVDLFPLSPLVGIYEDAVEVEIAVGSTALVATDAFARLLVGVGAAAIGGDGFEVVGNFDGFREGNPITAQFFLQVVDADGGLLASDALPETLPPFEAWEEAAFQLSGGAPGANFRVTGTLTSVFAEAIPEPTAALAWLAGLATLGWGVRARNARGPLRRRRRGPEAVPGRSI